MKNSLKIAIAGLLLAFSNNVIIAGPIDGWAEYPIPPGASAPISVTFGNNVFVAAGQGGTIITSTNGTDWTLANTPTASSFRWVKFLNGRFLTVQPFMVSTNGLDWSMLPTPTGQSSFPGISPLPPIDITFASGFYYILGGSTPPFQILKSSDLTNWSPVGSGSFGAFEAGNGAFVATAAPNLQDAYYSADGASWQFIASHSVFRHTSIAPLQFSFQNGVFFMIRNSPWTINDSQPGVSAFILSFSYDGLNWQNATAFAGQTSQLFPRRLAAGGGYYVLPAGNSVYYNTNIAGITSGDGGWTKVDLALSSPIGTSSDVAFGNNVFVAATLGKIFRSGQISGTEAIRFVKQPLSTAVSQGGTAHFTVQVQGSDPITYQWRRNGTNLTDQTSGSLTLTNLTSSMAGNYDVQVTNPAGTFTSDTATLTVHFADMLLYSGLTLRGAIGDKYLIEYQDSLQTNWQTISTVSLASPTYVYIDYDSPTHTNRFYRATFLQ